MLDNISLVDGYGQRQSSWQKREMDMVWPDLSLELKSAYHKCEKARRKIAVKVVDIFGNDTMKVIEVTI